VTRSVESAGQRPGRWRILRYPWSVAGLGVLVLVVAIGLLAPLLAPHDPIQGNLRARLLPPFWVEGGTLEHPLGTDQLGRDVLSRLMYGARASITVGLGVVVLSGIFGGVLGLIAGYFGGAVDDVLARLADWTLAFPFLVLAILLMGLLGPGLMNLTLVLALAGWPQFFRLMRGEALVERQKAYVEASVAIGRSAAGVIVFSILRNVFHIFFVLATIRLGIAILSEASLSFLGFGVPSHIPAWGSMISAGQAYVSTAWWLSTVPGVAILMLVLSVNLFGEGLRDATDPRLRD
jgi:ABC-type dipeptide/oligopeptide/nickel transport system permease subunit